ncbi:MAG: hypothetical protein WCG87_11925, partial [Bacteroidota bacterium]
TKSYNFNLNIVSCVSSTLGAYSISDQCASTNNYTDTVLMAPGSANTVMMKNFDQTGHTAYLTINCASGTINMSQQLINGITYSGSGNFYISSSRTIYLSVTKYTASSGYSYCSMNMNGIN